MPDNLAQMIIEAHLEKQLQEWLEKLDGYARQLGLKPQELRTYCKPLIQKALDKHFSD